MNKEVKKGLVPDFRFPEFLDSGEWEEINLGSIGKVSMCKRILKDETKPYGDIPFYKIGTFGKQADAYISKDVYERYKSKYSYPKKGDILISASGTIGRLVIFNGEAAYFQDSNIVWIGNNENLVKNSFLFYCYKRIKWATDNNTIARLYNDNLSGMKIFITSMPEQTKIAACLSSLDDLITAQTQKIEALKTHKKGLMQQLFPQEGETVPKLRFPEFMDSGEWECTTIGEVGKFYYGKSAPKWSLSNDAPTLCVRYGELYTKFGTIISEVLSRTNIDPSNLKFSKGGEILVPRVGEVPQDFAKNCCYLPFPNIAIGEMISVYETKEYPIFYTYYFRTMEQQFSRVVEGQNVRNLYYVNLEPIVIGKPSIPEQTKIADCLSSLDELIYSQVKKLDVLKLHKKGLMQGLFPSSNEAA